MYSPVNRFHNQVKQRGAALMIMLSILVVGFATVLVNTLSMSALNSVRQEKTSTALAQARDALLGRAVSDDNMPGSLPCPDTNNDGVAESTTTIDSTGKIHCPSYLGRLPWRTLNLPDLRDDTGERLWYALSKDFRDDSTAQPLNSNTKGTLLVYQADGTSLQTQAGYNAVAVIFSAGNPVNSQSRNTPTQQLDAANYLDIANSQNNAFENPPITGGISTNFIIGPFIAGTRSETFNDQLLFITTKDLIPLVEQRVAGVIKKALEDYYLNSSITPSDRYYPWADVIGATAEYHANDGQNRGWLPDIAAAGGTLDWLTGSPPSWFFDNQWYTVVYYSVGTSFSSYHSGGTLSVNGVPGQRVLFMMPGTPIGTLTRSISQLPDYLENQPGTVQNNDNADNSYVTPSSQARDRDRIYWLSSSSVWNQ